MSACIEESRQLSESHVMNAAKSLGFKMYQPNLLAKKLKKAVIPIFIIIAIVLAAILGALTYKHIINKPETIEQTQKSQPVAPMPVAPKPVAQKSQIEEQKQGGKETNNPDDKYINKPETIEQTQKSQPVVPMPVAPMPQTEELKQGSSETNKTDEKYLQVKVSKVVVRKSPDFNAKVIGIINRDERFKILCAAKDKKGVIWYEIDFVDGQIGWISNREKPD
jgi:hypothetical protein